MRITLPSGRIVALAELHQRSSYAGLLAGKPDAHLNRGHIDDLLEEAKRYTALGSEPILISPPQAALEDRLPAVCCIAVLTSDELARPGSEPYSSITVAWFQDDFAPPIASEVEHKIRQIDWERHAKDWCW